MKNEDFTEAMKLLLEIKEYCKKEYSKSNNLINNGTEMVDQYNIIYDFVDFRYEQGKMIICRKIMEMLTAKYISGEVK